MKRVIENKRLVFYIVTSIVIILYHMFYDLTFGDASGGLYSSVLDPSGPFMGENGNWFTALWDLSVRHWYHWSGRQVLEIFESIFGYIPVIYFQIVDVLIDILIVYCIESFCDIKDERIKYFFIGLLLSTYYVGKMGSAGFVSTSIVYSWTGAFALYIALNIRRLFYGEQIKIWQTIISCLAMIFAFNQEQCCGLMFGLVCCYIVACLLEKKKIPYQYFIFLGYAVFQIMIIIFCPGNIERSADEAASNPEFSSYTLQYKGYLGVWSMFRGWIKSPYTVLVVAIVIAYMVWTNRNMWTGVRKIINVFFACVFSLFNICIWVPDYYINVGTFGNHDSKIIFLFEFVTFMMLFWLLWELVSKKKIVDRLIFIGVLLSCVASKVVMGFSPTFVVSGERTTFYLTFGIFILLMYVIANNEEHFINSKMVIYKSLGYLFIIVMIINNIYLLHTGFLQ